jgi:protein phosphatase
MPVVSLPEPALIILVGPSGAGKSTFARRHFRATEVVSSDACRALLADDENAQEVSRDAFEVAELIAHKRLVFGRLTVIDATNVTPEARRQWLELARRHQVPIIAVVLDLPEEVCASRNAQRTDRDRGDYQARQVRQLEDSIAGLALEGFHQVHRLTSVEAVQAVEIQRTRWQAVGEVSA